MFKAVPPFGVHSDRLAALADLQVRAHAVTRPRGLFKNYVEQQHYACLFCL